LCIKLVIKTSLQVHVFAYCCMKLHFNIVLTSTSRPRSRTLLTNYLTALMYILKTPHKTYRLKKGNNLLCSPLSARKLVQCVFFKIKNLFFYFCILYSVIIHDIFSCHVSIINSCIRLPNHYHLPTYISAPAVQAFNHQSVHSIAQSHSHTQSPTYPHNHPLLYQ
jgi:hypothetical protein